MIEKYKVECFAATGLSYLCDPFEVYFDKEEAMLDFMDEVVPTSYTIKHYSKNKDGSWDCINE